MGSNEIRDSSKEKKVKWGVGARGRPKGQSWPAAQEEMGKQRREQGLTGRSAS